MVRVDCSKASDEELTKLSLQNPDYFTCLVDRYEVKLSKYIRRITNISPEESQDILQDVFISVYKNLNGFNVSLKFSSWIYRITRNHVISAHRKDKNSSKNTEFDETAEDLYAELSQPNSGIDIVIQREEAEIVREIIAKLKPNLREVFILRFLEDKDYSEISDILKKSMGTVSTWINRARSSFQAIAVQKGISFKDDAAPAVSERGNKR